MARRSPPTSCTTARPAASATACSARTAARPSLAPARARPYSRPVTRRPERQPDVPAPDGERERPAAPPPPHQLLELQRSHGNAAVTRALAREPAAPTSLQFTQPGRPRGSAASARSRSRPAAPDVEKAVDGPLRHNRSRSRAARPRCPRSSTGCGARSTPRPTPTCAIQMRVLAIVGAVPSTRQKPSLGRQAQKAASIANRRRCRRPASRSAPRARRSRSSSAACELKTAGRRAQRSRPTRRARGRGQEGRRQGRGRRQVGRQLVRRQDRGRRRKFGGKVERKGDSWKWSGGLVFQLAGDEVEELPDVAGVVAGAHGALADSLGHLRGGGSPTDAYITAGWGRSSRRSTPSARSPPGRASRAPRCA